MIKIHAPTSSDHSRSLSPSSSWCSQLNNPKYLGRQIWGRTHHGKPTPRTEWVWSEMWVHPPLVTAEEFTAADRHSWHVPSSAKTEDDSANALPSDHRRAA